MCDEDSCLSVRRVSMAVEEIGGALTGLGCYGSTSMSLHRDNGWLATI
jgi:hypothetical protein